MNFIAFTQNDIVLQLQLQAKPWKLLHTITDKTQVSNMHEKKSYSAIARRKKYTFLSSQNQHKSSIFSASEALI